MQTGKLRYTVIDLPLEALHSAAFRTAEIVRCAGDQGKFWEMRDRIFAYPQTATQADAHGAAVGLDLKRLDACLSAGKFDADIRKDMDQAAAAGVEGTPSFLLARPDAASGKLKPIRLIVGAQPFEAFRAQIDAALGQQGGQ